jgi:hypothetical protein
MSYELLARGGEDADLTNIPGRCWGAMITGGDGSNCVPGFKSGKAHFKVLRAILYRSPPP